MSTRDSPADKSAKKALKAKEKADKKAEKERLKAEKEKQKQELKGAKAKRSGSKRGAPDGETARPSIPQLGVTMVQSPGGGLRPQPLAPTKSVPELMAILVRAQGTQLEIMGPLKSTGKPAWSATLVAVRFNLKTFEIKYTGLRGNQEVKIDVRTIREIRTDAMACKCKGWGPKGGVDQLKALKRIKHVFVLIYGMTFDLKQLCCIANTQEEFEAWTSGLRQHTPFEAPELYTSNQLLSRWLVKDWDTLAKAQASLGLREVKTWLQRINYKISNRDAKDIFGLVDRLDEKIIAFPGFCMLYHTLCDVLSKAFEFVTSDPAKQLVSPADLLLFHQRYQMDDTIDFAMCERVVERYAGPDGRFTVNNFVEFLHSNENSIFNPYHDTVYQDMNQPLAHYFCNSSHNSYLMGSQITGESSVEAYVRCLLDGCRCVEIDTWNAKNGSNEPDPDDRIDVWHGNTMTSKIKFKDVLPSIMEHAFHASEWPVVLSIENHCNIENQKTMAKLFQQCFGGYLLCEPVPSRPEPQNAYPSPRLMRGRIIIKYKKLKTDGGGQVDGAMAYNSQREEEDIANALMNGTLLMEDHIDGSWTKHYFVLTPSKISYSEQPVVDENEEAKEEEDAAAAAAASAALPTGEDAEKQKELHYGEAWFHGRLQGGRHAAEALLRQHLPVLDPSAREGVFLVRESETFLGEFSLSFWREHGEQQVRHCRIRCKDSKYFLTDLIAFVNLYELIEYYRREPLVSKDFELKLREAVPQPAAHEDKKWFYKKLSRDKAEDMLRRIRSDGAFLVRESETSTKGYAISFRAEGKVKHCRITKSGRMYVMGDAEFDSLVNLVEYYEKVPLYKRMKLKYPVDAELLERQGEEPEEDIYNSCELYQTPNSVAMQAGAASSPKGITCSALYAYRATQGDELSFPALATITNVNKKDGGWWQGDYGQVKQGWLPSNYVEEIDHDELARANNDDAENPLGNVEKSTLDVDGLHVEPRPSTPNQRLIFRIVNSISGLYIDVGAEEEAEMKEWAKAIDDAAKTQKEQAGHRYKQEKKMSIAKEFSDLVFYVQSTHFKDFRHSKTACKYQVMSSFGEKKAMSLVADSSQPAEFAEYCRRQIARVYPKGSRVSSTNYDPQPCWNCGLQMVALNFQTADPPMWLNHGKFRQNGNCGYILKPKVLTEEPLAGQAAFNPHVLDTYKDRVEACELKIKIVAGRHLLKPKRGVLSPFVELEIIGVPVDKAKYKTRTIPDNGFNPVWNEHWTATIQLPELACLQVTVFDEDMFGDTTPIAQCVMPIGPKESPTLRQGWRSVILKSPYNHKLEMSAVLLHIELKYMNADDSKQEEYQSLAQLRQQMLRVQAQRNEQVQAAGQQLATGQGVGTALGELNAEVYAIEQQMLSAEGSSADEFRPPPRPT